ncbi:nucleotidyltransferase family protein [Halobaculum sp. CBA1158]|uniref:nucleotidyltransferase family protein n=1 Tax=Halobaculum sp. CBA1158 TaxID=2904243 RepID=UPI001F414ED4|nr:nucleotidyltransferase family protein [Halobaculum sp. CBA1158]UIP00450.1 nucleotidyltransferase family protein [Halobaculum sp. CBA1158]
MTDPDLPIVDPAAIEQSGTRSPRVAGVVLAGGTSSRFGAANKLLATVEGEPLVRRALRTLTAAELDPVIVVVGHEAEAVREALPDDGERVVEADDYATGQAASVRRGIAAVVDAADDAAAATFLPGDMPFVDAETVRTLVDAYAAGAGDALAPAHEDRRGNPVLFDRRHFEALAGIEGDTGGRAVLLGSDDAALVAVDDRGVAVDVDTPADLARHR